MKNRNRLLLRGEIGCYRREVNILLLLLLLLLLNVQWLSLYMWDLQWCHNL